MNAQDAFMHQLKKSQNVLFLSGAGISVASGIAPFRGTDPEAVWNKDVTEKGTFRYFREDVLGSWCWYLDRFSSLFGKQPNPAHYATTALSEWFALQNRTFTIATQNIDGLHHTHDSVDVLEVHGSSRFLRCASSGCTFGEPRGKIPFPTEQIEAFKKNPQIQNIPSCPECGDFLRPHVLWFDEMYTAHQDYRFSDFTDRLYDTDLCICVGTSFSVNITYIVVKHCVENKVPLWIVDPVPPDNFYDGIYWLTGKAEEILPAIVDELTT